MAQKFTGSSGKTLGEERKEAIDQMAANRAVLPMPKVLNSQDIQSILNCVKSNPVDRQSVVAGLRSIEHAIWWHRWSQPERLSIPSAAVIKKLEQGTFERPQGEDISITSQQLTLLMEGVMLKTVRLRKRYTSLKRA